MSAEVLIYALFWAVLPFLFRWRIGLPLIASAVCFVLGRYSVIANCGAYFFLGCAIYAFHRIATRRWQWAAVIAALLTFGAVLGAGYQGIAVLFLFIGLTLACAASENDHPSRWAAAVPWIGENTYGVYLWHIPVQLSLLLGLAWLGISRDIAYSPWFLLLFLALVTIIARISFLTIEKPARRAIRNLFKPRDRHPLPSADAKSV